MPFTVYILKSESTGRYYIGQTQDFDERLKRHNSGSEFATSPYIPWILLWKTVKVTRSEALILEKKLKNLSRERIRVFIQKHS